MKKSIQLQLTNLFYLLILESRRLQALKENNMEAYIALVQETKNTRLKYLLQL